MMNTLIGPDNHNKPNTYLEECGRDYSNYKMVNDVRRRFLESVPTEKVTQLFLDFDNKNLEGNFGVTKTVNFCIIQQDKEKVPVFLLPATAYLTSEMSVKARNKYMEEIFTLCYTKYCRHCEEKKLTPISKKYCAATVVAGTKTMWGGNHFIAMIKPPGNEQWQEVDPTSFGGPQWINRKQCGGYSSMIEAEALMHYSSKSVDLAEKEEKENTVLRHFKQFIERLSFKFKTWFAGKRNEVTYNAGRVKKFETTYAEMADFSAGRLAKKFGNKGFFHSSNKIDRTEEEEKHDHSGIGHSRSF